MRTGRRLAAVAACVTVLGSGASGVAWGDALDAEVPVSKQDYLVQEPYDPQNNCDEFYGDYVPGFGVNPYSELEDECEGSNSDFPPPVNEGESPPTDDRGVVPPA
ncbi:hypothetical protein [Rhodococcus marinonascens]|uniref:hypothetical protein n=1 Tax=Rhodococcus marinonascens TaxID=38311 RepID=UPI000935522F|nr:hypothetical protein [Rhodococcus marinonascens]